jgi:hypothetical protein
MNAWTLAANWLDEVVADLRSRAAAADSAYDKDPMAAACKAYAASLRRAADRLEEDKRAFYGRAQHEKVSAWKATANPGPSPSESPAPEEGNAK